MRDPYYLTWSDFRDAGFTVCDACADECTAGWCANDFTPPRNAHGKVTSVRVHSCGVFHETYDCEDRAVLAKVLNHVRNARETS